MYAETALIAYLVDRTVGEFRFIRHPVVLMGNYIKWFEKHFYKESLIQGAWLGISLISIVMAISYLLQSLLLSLGSHHPTLITSILIGTIGSTAIASKMLFDSVKGVIDNPQSIRYLVSRDTGSLNHSDINKAAIETYAENLSDGVVAPLFYLLLFGLPGAFVYKAVNTLDSMVGYRNERYERFGKFAARLDDAANYIPARITAAMITVFGGALAEAPGLLFKVFRQGRDHDSPNAGYPISAMAFSLGIRVGGAASYFGKIRPKPCFGEGRETITTEDIRHALSFQQRFDIFFILLLGALIWA